MKSLLTNKQRVLLANQIRSSWASPNSNTYVGIGHVKDWPSSDTVIPEIDPSVDGENQVFENLIAIKKITDSDMALVVPRVDWTINTVYDEYDNTKDMFSTEKTTQKSGTVFVSSTNNSVTGVGTTFSTDYIVGDFISFYDFSNGNVEKREVVSIQNNTILSINTAFSVTTSSNTYYSISDNSPQYALTFYVRNSFDQVFVCMDNVAGAMSTQEPQISLAGSLPTNPYILTADGYKWKYLFTIPSGLKSKFFSTEWMPVTTSIAVQNSAVDGRLDVIRILNGGTGYNGNVAVSNAAIITVSGDGSGANAVATVSGVGTITDITILSGGSGYTYANVTAIAGLTGANAVLEAVIQPHNGFGFDPSSDLGAKNIMVCVELTGDEGGAIPVSSGIIGDIVDYHQISIIQNPRLSSNTQVVASGSVYNTTTGISTGALPAGSEYTVDDIAFQGVSLDVATFYGTIVNWDPIANKVYLNNIHGTFVPFTSLRATLLGANITAFSEFLPSIKLYTGDILYIENRLGVSRAANQTEQIKLVIEL